MPDEASIHRGMPGRGASTAPPPRAGLVFMKLASAIVLVVLSVAGAVRVEAAQYSPPWADALRAHWPGTGGLDTTSTMNKAASKLDQIGYNAVSVNPSSARAAMGEFYAQSDAVWWMAGHAGTGFITTYNNTNSTTVINVSGSVQGSSCTGKNTCLTEYTFSQMHDTRLMVFQGCESGRALSNGDSLPKRAKQVLGVDASVGFSKIIYFSGMTSDLWADDFGYRSGLGQTVLTAAWGAANTVKYMAGAYWGYDSYVIYGGSTVISPASYGN